LAVEIKVPRLGWSMEEGTFVEWLKRDGELVEAGQPLFSIEGDKAIQDVEAIGSGILRISPGAPESGEAVRVGATLAYLVGAHEPDPFAADKPKQPQPDPKPPERKPEVPQPKPAQPTKPGPEIPRPGTTPSKTPPPAVPEPEIPPPSKTPSREVPPSRTPAPEVPSPAPPEISPAEPPQHEPGSPTFAAYASAAQESGSDGGVRSAIRRRRISPRALRIADELAIDWQVLDGTGRAGRIRECDIRVAAERSVSTRGRPRVSFAAQSNTAGANDGAPRTVLRRTIAARMTAGARETAPVTLTTTADATNLFSLREQFKAGATGDEVPPGYLAFITKLAARALTEHRALNQLWIDGRIERPEAIHFAVAVDTSAGLLAPVIRDVPSLGVREIALSLADLSSRAESGRLRPAELTGGTFTISNLGAYGIDAFTPIINIPQCAILGLGRIEKRPAVVDDQIVPRDQMVLSLTFDHRIVDGAPAAKFLANLREKIENPGPWLVS
jgi:pyruvate dehydrogenase E2 component (dihydrolipoamide acetyltransferase)